MEKIIKQDRLITVDILRGIALLGILLAHFIFWHTGGPLPPHVYEKNYGPGSTVANFFHMIFIFGKFFAFFAFLFGVSFHLQMQSLEKQGIYAPARFARRLFILLIIGIIHHFFWMGDILSIYATLGFTLLFFKKLNDRSLFITGIVLALALPNKVWDAVNFLFIHLESG
ncbi:MAG TPA: hypothetical protein VK907_07470, partial [Phnomibacter sp.]|nr:hypothetical protein [Phnomibacter sp.]